MQTVNNADKDTVVGKNWRSGFRGSMFPAQVFWNASLCLYSIPEVHVTCLLLLCICSEETERPDFADDTRPSWTQGTEFLRIQSLPLLIQETIKNISFHKVVPRTIA